MTAAILRAMSGGEAAVHPMRLLQDAAIGGQLA
jgi:hypothetical protein